MVLKRMHGDGESNWQKKPVGSLATMCVNGMDDDESDDGNHVKIPRSQ